MERGRAAAPFPACGAARSRSDQESASALCLAVRLALGGVGSSVRGGSAPFCALLTLLLRGGAAFLRALAPLFGLASVLRVLAAATVLGGACFGSATALVTRASFEEAFARRSTPCVAPLVRRGGALARPLGRLLRKLELRQLGARTASCAMSVAVAFGFAAVIACSVLAARRTAVISVIAVRLVDLVVTVVGFFAVVGVVTVVGFFGVGFVDALVYVFVAVAVAGFGGLTRAGFFGVVGVVAVRQAGEGDGEGRGQGQGAEEVGGAHG